MRIFTNTWFQRFAKKENLSDQSLKKAVRQMERGTIDADLGGDVYKQRLARPGGGKSGGYRAIVCFRKGSRAFLVYGFAKSDRDNITSKELKSFRKLAGILFSYSDEQLENAVRKGVFNEIS